MAMSELTMGASYDMGKADRKKRGSLTYRVFVVLIITAICYKTINKSGNPYSICYHT